MNLQKKNKNPLAILLVLASLFLGAYFATHNLSFKLLNFFTPWYGSQSIIQIHKLNF